MVAYSWDTVKEGIQDLSKEDKYAILFSIGCVISAIGWFMGASIMKHVYCLIFSCVMNIGTLMAATYISLHCNIDLNEKDHSITRNMSIAIVLLGVAIIILAIFVLHPQALSYNDKCLP